MRRLRIALHIAAATFAAASASSAIAGCTIESIEIPVKMVGQRAVATVGINDTPVPLAVDSGAFFSFLTDAAAAQLGLPTKPSPVRTQGFSGRVDTRMTTVESLKLFKGEIPHADFLVGGTNPGAGTLGLLGRDILGRADTEYDLANGAIRISYPKGCSSDLSMAYWAGKTPVNETDLTDGADKKYAAIRTRVKLNGKEMRAFFDTGATTIVSLRAAKRLGITEADMTPSRTVRGAGRGSLQSWTARFATFEIGGEKISNNQFEVADFDTDDEDMIIGIDYFLSHRIYISKAQSTMFLTYNGGTVFALNRRDSDDTANPSTDRAAADAQPMTADQLGRRAAGSAARNDNESALADLNRAFELATPTAALLAQRGRVHAALGHSKESLNDLDKALALDSNAYDARLERASVRLATRDIDGGNADLAELDKALPRNAQLRLSMANLYSRHSRWAEQIAQLNLWLPTHPDEPGRYVQLNSRCWDRVMLGTELDLALKDCDEAIDANDKDPNVLDSRAWVYLRLGQYDKALKDFDRALAIAPKTAASLYGRGWTKKRLGNATQGDADIAAALVLQPSVARRMAFMNDAKETAASSK